MALAPGTRLGTYEIIAALGAGGMGDVYRARDTKLRRDVALKVLPAAVAADPDRIARFEREAHAVAALSHPNILAIHDFGSDASVHYVVTELLEGETLREILRTGPLAPAKGIAIATHIARGLEAAHARGIVHRDLKPENLFVSPDGHVKILDFGLAKRTESGDRHDATGPADADRPTTVAPGVTGVGTVLGTAGYMAPEQVRGTAVDQRTDIFALGCVLYELLAGRRPFQGDSSIETLHATLHADPPDLATLAAVLDPLARIVTRCLEKQPAYRFQTAADLRFALDTMSDTLRQRAPSLPVHRPLPWLRIGVAAVVISAAAAGAWYWRGRPSSGPAAAVPQARGIAVLPFENLGAADQAYFAAGVTEEVTLQIAKISAIRVMSRAAVSRFKDPAAQLPDMARDLGIGAVLIGSVRHAGSQVRVGVQLLEVPSGVTLWSEQYDRTLANIFDVQSDIAVRVARALRASLAPEERRRIERAPTDNTGAYELYLQQRRFSAGSPEQNQQGIDLLQKAIALDPDFALGYAELGQRLVFKGNVYGRTEYLRAVEAGRNAVRIDPQLARGHHTLGIALNRTGQTEAARLSMQRAIELDNNYGSAMYDLALIEQNAGRLDHSAYWAMRAWPLAPNVATSYYHLGLTLIFLDDAVAERWLSAAAARFTPSESPRLVILRAILALRRGDAARAVALARDAVRASPTYSGSRSVLREVATYTGAAGAEALVEVALQESPSGRSWWSAYTPRTLRGYLHLRAGQSDRARPLLETVLDLNRRAIEDGDRSKEPWWEDVAAQAMLGNREAALVAWERAVEIGLPETKIDVYDPLIASIKDDPRFVAALDRVRRRVAEMRARVDLSIIDEWIARGTPTNAVR